MGTYDICLFSSVIRCVVLYKADQVGKWICFCHSTWWFFGWNWNVIGSFTNKTTIFTGTSGVCISIIFNFIWDIYHSTFAFSEFSKSIKERKTFFTEYADIVFRYSNLYSDCIVFVVL